MKCCTLLLVTFLFATFLFATTGAFAQTGIFDFENTSNTSDVAMVSDKAGRFHTIMVQPSTTSEALQYYFKDGDTWTQGNNITTASGSTQLTGIDLAIDSTSTLHATYYDRGDVFYATLDPSETDWQVSLIENGATGTTPDLRHRTTIDIRENASGITPQVAYTRTGAPGNSSFGVYAFLDTSGSWIQEDITPGGDEMGARFAVISSEPLPSAGLIFGGTRGPAIAYYENGEYLITQRSVSFGTIGQPSTVSWSTPIVVAEGPANTLNPSFFELDFEVANNVAHLICNGTAPDNTSGLLYNRRFVGFGIGIGIGQQVFSTYENIDEGNSGDTEALSLATDSSGIPHACFVRTTNNGWEFIRARRTATDTWAQDTIFSPPINFAGEPDTAAIAVDIFGRPGVIATRENDVDTRATTISDLPLASSTFTIDGETDSTDVPGSLAIDGLGGAGFAYKKEGDTAVSFRYRDPSTGALTTTDLNLDIPDANTNPVVNDVLATAYGSDRIAVVTQVTSDAPGLNRTIQRRLFVFARGQTSFIETLTNRTGFAISLPPVSIAGDESTLYIASIFLTSITGNVSAPTLQAFGLDGSRNTILEDEFNAEVPGGYRLAKLRAEGGTLGIIGLLDDTLSVHFRLSNGRWEDDVAIESATALPTQYDLAFRPGSAIATYADGSTIYVATTVRSGNGTISNTMPRVRITSTFDGAQLAISSIGDDVQVITRNLGGGDFGDINQYLYDGFPREDGSNLKSIVKTFDFTSEAAFAFDRFGFPAILAVEQSTSPANRLLITSALTVDADGDGMPLFQELAICRNPAIPDNLNTLAITKTPTGSTVAFDRVPGPATGTAAGINAGAFTYGIEFSNDLDGFSDDTSIIFERTPSAGDPAVANGTLQEASFTERLPGTLDYSRFFYRIRVGLR